MPDALPNPTDGLLHLDSLRYDEILEWLERALGGREWLPMIVPDETPESPILRERRLSPRTRDDLRQACLTLLRRFIRKPQEKDNYVLALLRLTAGYQLNEAVTDLHSLASNFEQFSTLPPVQRWAILSSLMDLRAPLSVEFWKEIATRFPDHHGVTAIAGLLPHGYHTALKLLSLLPDKESVADALYVVLDQYTSLLNPNEQRKFADAALQVRPDCPLQIQAAIDDWILAHPLQASSTPKMKSFGSKLDAALAAFATRSNESYSPRPCVARLIPQEAT